MTRSQAPPRGRTGRAPARRARSRPSVQNARNGNVVSPNRYQQPNAAHGLVRPGMTRRDLLTEVGEHDQNWWVVEVRVVKSGGGYVLCLRAFLTLGDFHRHRLAFVQGFAAFAVNCAVVDEHILAVFLLNETITFVIAEPFYGSGYSLCHIKHSLISVSNRTGAKRVGVTYADVSAG